MPKLRNKHKEGCPAGILEGENARCTCNEKPDIKVVARDFGKAHKEEAEAKGRKDKYRKQFFDLIDIPEQELARKTIFAECDDPEAYVASLYPKWRILKKEFSRVGDWKILIQEDPEKKNFVLVNPLDGQVYQRTVAESAPDVDLDRLKAEHPSIYRSVTFQPKPPR
jgi:hypothetical protein